MLAPLGRKDRRQWGGVFLRGRLLDGERKRAGAMAARLPDGNEQSLQQFLNQSPWDWLPLWHQRAARVERTFAPAVAWIVDDTGFPKKGEHSVGVARQSLGHTGPDGPLPNCSKPAPHRRPREFAAGLLPLLAPGVDRGSRALPSHRCTGRDRVPDELAISGSTDRPSVGLGTH